MVETKEIKKKTIKKVKAEKVKPVVESVLTSEPAVVEAVIMPGEADGKKKSEYLFGIGRRKSATAQVRVYKKGSGVITVNGKDFKVYFPLAAQQDIATSPLKIVGQVEKLDVVVKVLGGGFMSQTEAMRHGLSRALLLLNQNFRKPLKKAGFLTRDSRKKERKKPGLKRARKAPQWAKR